MAAQRPRIWDLSGRTKLKGGGIISRHRGFRCVSRILRAHCRNAGNEHDHQGPGSDLFTGHIAS